MRSKIEARVHAVRRSRNIAQHRPSKDMVGVIFFAAVIDGKAIFILIKNNFIQLSRCNTKVLKEICLQNTADYAHQYIGGGCLRQEIIRSAEICVSMPKAVMTTRSN